jgi:hypothetical protein
VVLLREFGSKKLNGQDALLKLAQEALCTICLADQKRRRHCTVKLGKDASPSSLMDHMRIHHQDDFNAVVVANSKGVSLVTFTAKRQEPRVRTLLGNSSKTLLGNSSKASIPHRKGIIRKMSEMRALMEDEIVGMMHDE